MVLALSSIYRYPVKSCQGEPLARATVEPWGLAGDRRWMVVDPEGKFITARETHKLLTITPEITSSGLRLHAPGRPSLNVSTPDPRAQIPVAIWKSKLTAAATPEGSDWLSEVIAREARLVYLDDPRRRATSPEYSRPDDRVSFADSYPLLLTTEASLAALNEMLNEPVPMTRFRPSVVVSGGAAWAEDDWRHIRIGAAEFRVAKGCARCVMVTLEPNLKTGEVVGGKEPTRALAQSRRFGSGVWFGANLIPDTPGAVIRLGDPVEILESAPSGTGPIGA